MSRWPENKWDELAALPEDEARAVNAALDARTAEWLLHDWPGRARAEQLAPPGDDWRVWLVMAGRGFGKTRAGAEWVRGVTERDGSARIALVGASLHEARSVMVEGESGLLAIAPWWDRPEWHPALRRLDWKSGARATLFGAADPDSLRGAQFSHGWADEIAKWPHGVAAWDNMMMALRLGERPRVVATTTPRPVPLLRRLLGEDMSDVAVTRGRTADNAVNLPPGWVEAMMRDYGGGRLARQELDGEMIEELDGALWSRALIERCRIGGTALPVLARTVVAVDPPAGSEGDACGIIVAALGEDGRGYVLADASVERPSPERWASAVAAAAASHGADRVVAEANNGGAMVESVLRAAGRDLPIRLVHASRGKTARAEPVAALYEAGRVSHLGGLPMLEDQMCGLMTGGGYDGPGRSPDRADALVWALSELMLRQGGGRQAIRIL